MVHNPGKKERRLRKINFMLKPVVDISSDISNIKECYDKLNLLIKFRDEYVEKFFKIKSYLVPTNRDVPLERNNLLFLVTYLERTQQTIKEYQIGIDYTAKILKLKADEMEKAAAVKIQSFYRGYLNRK